MEITEKVAYLKGLMEGMKIDTESNEGKILTAMADILEDIGLELEDLWNAQGELEDGLDVVSDDLEDVEDTVYGDEDDECRLIAEHQKPLPGGTPSCPSAGRLPQQIPAQKDGILPNPVGGVGKSCRKGCRLPLMLGSDRKINPHLHSPL